MLLLLFRLLLSSIPLADVGLGNSPGPPRRNWGKWRSLHFFPAIGLQYRTRLIAPLGSSRWLIHGDWITSNSPSRPHELGLDHVVVGCGEGDAGMYTKLRGFLFSCLLLESLLAFVTLKPWKYHFLLTGHPDGVYKADRPPPWRSY